MSIYDDLSRMSEEQRKEYIRKATEDIEKRRNRWAEFNPGRIDPDQKIRFTTWRAELDYHTMEEAIRKEPEVPIYEHMSTAHMTDEQKLNFDKQYYVKPSVITVKAKSVK